MSTPEELARQIIDALLVECGWIVQNYKKLDLSAGRGIAIREVRRKEGRCNCLLLIDRKPVGIIEAKKAGATLSQVADQCGRSAENLADFLRGDLAGKLPYLYDPPASRPTSATNASRRAHSREETDRALCAFNEAIAHARGGIVFAAFGRQYPFR